MGSVHTGMHTMAAIGLAALGLAACGGGNPGGVEAGYGAHTASHGPSASATTGASATVGTTQIDGIGPVLADS